MPDHATRYPFFLACLGTLHLDSGWVPGPSVVVGLARLVVHLRAGSSLEFSLSFQDRMIRFKGIRRLQDIVLAMLALVGLSLWARPTIHQKILHHYHY
jgi:hypothetical protein